MKLLGNLFVITGGASGLGEACARHFVKQGANVAILDLQEDAGKRVAESLGENALFTKTDVTSEANVQEALNTATEKFGPIRGVINCAGILHAARVLGKHGPYPLDKFTRVIEVNLIGTFNVIRLAAAFMAESKPLAPQEGEPCDNERGVIINTSSVAAFDGQIGQASYSATKGAIVAMTLPMARELARHGIRVVAIAPGVFDTAMMAGLPPEAKASLEAQVPFPPRLGQPKEYAQLAQHIAENKMLNGTTIRLDGALRMGS